MLQRFKVRNYKNFRDDLIFSLRTLKNYEFNIELIKDGIIKDCLVVGENASGKTNLALPRSGSKCIKLMIDRV